MGNPGVYVVREIEIVRTREFEMIIRRKSEPETYLEATLSRLHGHDRELIGICQMDKGAQNIRHAIRRQIEDGEPVGNDDALIQMIGTCPSIAFQKTGDSWKGLFADAEYDLMLAEPIHVRLDNTVDKPKIRESSIGTCLREWSKGVFLQQGEDGSFAGVTIDTNTHMFIFCLGTSMVYIRAARVHYCDQGIVFAQNIRMYDNQGKYRMTYMVEDNRVAAEALSVNYDAFDLIRCTTPGSITDGIYWSLKSFDENKERILLNGCEGAEYEFGRDIDCREMLY